MSIVLGITGGIGSGKSFVCRILERCAIPIYDTDSRAKALYNEDEVLRNKMIELFGQQLYEAETGLLDRAYLANRIFSEPSLLKQVSNLVHPAVRRDFDSWHKQQQTYGIDLVGIESAILFQSKELLNRIDYSLLVEAPIALRLDRAMKRDKQDKETILKRINTQMSDDEMRSHANYLIHNDNTTMLLPQIEQIIRQIRQTSHY